MWIALVLFFSCLVLLVSVVFWQAQNIARAIPFSAEKRFIRPYETIIGKLFGDSRQGSVKIEAYLSDLGDKIARAMQLTPGIELTVHYLDSDETNAFATLGGHIFILSGLMKSMPDENSLAMVLAHEIAHIEHRDPAASMSRGMALQMVFALVTGNSTEITDIVGSLGQSLYSRQQESIADIAALHALDALYGHVGGYRTFFTHIGQIYPEQEPDSSDYNKFESWFSSHPGIQTRLDALDKEVKAMGTLVSETKQIPEYIRNRL